MATDEKRRLIYELIVEAVDLKKSTDAAAAELKKVSTSAGDMALGVKRAFAALGVAASLKAIFSQSAEMRKFNDSIKDVGAAFADAALQASGFMTALNDPGQIQRWKDEADSLGDTVGYLYEQFKKGRDFLNDPTGAGRRLEQQANDLTMRDSPFEGWAQTGDAQSDWVKFDPTLTSTMKLLEDAMDAVRIDASGAAKSMQDSAAAAKYWAAFDAEITANTKERLAAESRAAANDARRNTRQFAFDATQFKSDMQASVESTAAVRDLTDDIGNNVERMAQASKGFNEDWDSLAAHTFTVNEGLEKAIDYMRQLQEQQSDLANQALEWGLALQRAFKGVLTGELHNTRDLLRSIVSDMRDFYAELAAREAAMQVLMGVKKVITSIFGVGAADGEAFSGGRVVPFATGGVVSSPTAFPMAGGNTGVMGEAGPEAVMPLRRGGDGRLGVSALRPVVNLNNTTGVPMKASASGTNERMEITLEAAQLGARMAEANFNRSIRSGYGTTAQSLQRSYGLRRRV